MPYHRLSTSKIAHAVGVHPNTVRLYESWGYLPSPPRSRSGYRLYTPFHLDQMKLARMAFTGDWPGHIIRKSSVRVVLQSAAGDLGGALESAYRHLATVQAEHARAETAVLLLQRWAEGNPVDSIPRKLRIREAADWLEVTVDQLRNWERNGLIDVPRDEVNGYRMYGSPELSRLRVIRMLRTAGYSPMAILRMLTRLDQGERADLRKALTTPEPDEDVFHAADRWLTALNEQEQIARQMIELLEEMIRKHGSVYFVDRTL